MRNFRTPSPTSSGRGSKTYNERTACRSNASTAANGGPANSTEGVLAEYNPIARYL